MNTANIQHQYCKLKQFNFCASISSPKENSVASGNLVYFRRLKSGTTSSSVWRILFYICVASLNMNSLWCIVGYENFRIGYIFYPVSICRLIFIPYRISLYFYAILIMDYLSENYKRKIIEDYGKASKLSRGWEKSIFKMSRVFKKNLVVQDKKIYSK